VDIVYHVLNRANARMQLFYKNQDYKSFEEIIASCVKRVPIRIISYCILPNHWHFILWPCKDGDLSELCVC